MHYRVGAHTRTQAHIHTYTHTHTHTKPVNSAQLASSPDRIQQVRFSLQPETCCPETLGSFLKSL